MPRQLSAGPHLITTTPSLITCRRCSRPVLAATVGGLDVHVDTACLNEAGEVMALIEGRSTYNLVGERLYRRGPEKIREGGRTAPVLGKHSCAPVPDEHIDPVWSEVATAIIVHACGGVIVNETKIAFLPPF